MSGCSCRLIGILLLLACLPSAAAQQIEAYRNTVDGGYDFWFYQPDDSSQRQPLLVFLHGASLCGNNLEKVRRYGPLHALQMGLEIPSLIVAPQNPGGAWKPERIMRTIQWVEHHYPVDTNRIYVFGMSLGGYGTIDLVGTYPDRIAAAIAMCGGSQLHDFCGLTEVPLWILHGTADRDVPISQSTRIIEAMKRCGDTQRLLFTRLEGVNHGGPARAFYLTTTYEWLFSHRLDTPLRPITPGYAITPADLKGAYGKLRRGNVQLKVKESDATPGDNRTSEKGKQHYYTVKKGDTLGRIARKQKTSIEKLCQLNGLKRTSIIRPGQRLRLP